jgi:hypothetical protein
MTIMCYNGECLITMEVATVVQYGPEDVLIFNAHDGPALHCTANDSIDVIRPRPGADTLQANPRTLITEWKEENE